METSTKTALRERHPPLPRSPRSPRPRKPEAAPVSSLGGALDSRVRRGMDTIRTVILLNINGVTKLRALLKIILGLDFLRLYTVRGFSSSSRGELLAANATAGATEAEEMRAEKSTLDRGRQYRSKSRTAKVGYVQKGDKVSTS